MRWGNIKEYLEVKRLIFERTLLHENDPRISDYWAKIVDSFGYNEQEMIEILNSCSEFEIGWLREVYDDLAFKFRTENYLRTLEMLQKKFPKIDMEFDIQFVKKIVLS